MFICDVPLAMLWPTSIFESNKKHSMDIIEYNIKEIQLAGRGKGSYTNDATPIRLLSDPHPFCLITQSKSKTIITRSMCVIDVTSFFSTSC